MRLTDTADTARIQLSTRLDAARQSELGQFLTPTIVARFMARQFRPGSGQIRLLDPGAGTGTLTAAFVEHVLATSPAVTRCDLIAYEIDPLFIPDLQQCLESCCAALANQGIRSTYSLYTENFITTTAAGSLSQSTAQPFTHAILNPPYKKIHRQAIEKHLLTRLGLNTVNLYSAFVWLALSQLTSGGELVAITPRSFCNGQYFRPFRQALLDTAALSHIHLFASRSNTFADDAVLQENIIFHATKTQLQPDVVTLSSSTDPDLEKFLERRKVPYTQIVDPQDADRCIHIIPNALEDALSRAMTRFSTSLTDLGLAVSTGPVVDFRLKPALRHQLEPHHVPLLYPEALQTGTVVFPPQNPRKPIALEHNLDTQKWLIPPGWYVLTRRFSAKEEKRRVVAAVCPPLAAPALGIENHLNYFHAQGKGMDPDLARGLTAFLNSSCLDQYFRHFSGHTQVNATDLRRIRYPHRAALLQLGRTVGKAALDQSHLDRIVHTTLSIEPAAIKAVLASQRQAEALALLKKLAIPKAQHHERSALCLLALANLQPERLWHQAIASRQTLTEMMAWMEQHYGKHYTPSAWEAFRRETIQPWVQLGLIAEPGGSGKSEPRYQLQAQVIENVRSYQP